MRLRNLDNMGRTVLLETPYVKIQFDHLNKIIVAKWFGYLELKEVKHGCSFMSEYFRDHVITKHLSEHRDLEILSKEVQQYLVNEWFPEIERLGVKKVAAIAARDAFAEATVKKVNIQGSTGNLEIKMFQTEADCLHWLLLGT